MCQDILLVSFHITGRSTPSQVSARGVFDQFFFGLFFFSKTTLVGLRLISQSEECTLMIFFELVASPSFVKKFMPEKIFNF